MKFLIFFVLVLFSASALDLGRNKFTSSSAVSEGRIANGQNATEGQFPYQVGLELKVNNFSSWCGGSLISNEWILTAAHCVKNIDSLTIHLGATVRTTAEVEYTVKLDDIITHPDWNSQTIKSDIAVVKIPATAYTAKIQPVKLPRLSNFYPSYVGDRVVATGWGATSDTDFSGANHLQWARMQVINSAPCIKEFDSLYTPTNVCVSTRGAVSVCIGDSGGPLVLESSQVQIGITSYGSSTSCEMGYPVVFTRVTSYLKWIKDVTGVSN